MTEIRLKVSSRYTLIPSDRKIFGNFIESGFGCQVRGIWSEMLYNRAFRKVPEYKKATWEWLGLDADHYNENAPFWHSGYEENDWKVTGNPAVRYSCGNYTYKGSTSLLMDNRTEGTECGLAQQGLHLTAGKEYCFSLTAGVRGDIGSAGLNGFGDTIHSSEEKKLRIKIGEWETEAGLTTVVRKFTWNFTAERTEIVPIRFTFSFEGTVIFVCASLMPADNLMGWRRDVVEKLRKVSPSVVRFPGGCFVSFYDWESSIGDRDLREVQESYYWGGLEENDVGLDEFMQLANLVGFEPQICFNMMTSTPFKARQMVEYLNAPADTGMGRLRMLNGHAAPYGVKLFEMDNEPGRKWTAEQYAKACVAFAEEMRRADPEITFMLAAYAYDPGLLPRMLEIVGKEISYVIYRQGNPEFVREILPVIRRYNEANGTGIRLANTEWLPSCKSPEPFEDPEIPQNFSWRGEVANNYKNIFSTQQVSWNYALNGARRLLDYISYGGEFALANFNNMCNTWGQNVIEATKEECYLSCMGHVFAFFARNFEPCRAMVLSTGETLIYALAVKTESDREQLYLVNSGSRVVEVRLSKSREGYEKNRETGKKGQGGSLKPEGIKSGGIWTATDGLSGVGRMYGERPSKSVVRRYRPDIRQGVLTLEGLSIACLEKM